MGMYDTFIGVIKCPNCGMMAEINEQTKSYDCLLMDFKVGDTIDKAYANYTVPVDSYCKECKNQFTSYAIIKSGRLTEYSDRKEIDCEKTESSNPVEVMNGKIVVNLGFANLVAENCTNEPYKQIAIYLEQDDVIIQDIALIESTLDTVDDNEVRVLVFADKNDEDYTDEFTIGLTDFEE